MRSLIAIAALVASVSASAGSLDGKAIVCEIEAPSNSFPSKLGFAFNESEVFRHWVSFRRLHPEVTINVSDPVAYIAYLSFVEWRGSSTFYSLDRRSLLLTVKMGDSDDGVERPCEALPSWEALNEIMESVRAEEQSKNDAEMKDNKI